MAASISLKLVREAGKKIRILPDRALRQNLEYAGLDEVEAYKLGVEEAQHDIMARLDAIQKGLKP